MLLTQLKPRWIGENGRSGLGVSFDCPHCFQLDPTNPAPQRLAIAFQIPLDGGERASGFKNYWERHGETFEDLSLVPSIDASGFGHWHGWMSRGRIC